MTGSADIMVAGVLDGLRGREIFGWACGGVDDKPQFVDILVDGECIGKALANGYREDLRASGIRDGYAAFSFELADTYFDGIRHEIDVRLAGSTESLAQTPQSFSYGARTEKHDEWVRNNIVLSTIDRASLIASIKGTRKIAVFATYHRHFEHLKYHQTIIRSLLDMGYSVLCVHSVDDQAVPFRHMAADNCFGLLKRNIGYDFGSYAVGFIVIEDMLDDVDEMIFVNDSIVQVADDLWPLLQRFRAAEADVVACTESFERRYHLQSYFLWLNRKAAHSKALAKFMSNYSYASEKERVIEEGEIGLSLVLQKAGLRLRALYEYPALASVWLEAYEGNKEFLERLAGKKWRHEHTQTRSKELECLENVMHNVIAGRPANPSHFFWDVLIDHFDFPFIKRELITTNPCSVPTYVKIAGCFRENREVYEAVYQMLRTYGGNLVPTPLAMPHEAAARSAPNDDPNLLSSILERQPARRIGQRAQS